MDGIFGIQSSFCSKGFFKSTRKNNNDFISVNIPKKSKEKGLPYQEWIQQNGLNTQQKQGELGRRFLKN